MVVRILGAVGQPVIGELPVAQVELALQLLEEGEAMEF